MKTILLTNNYSEGPYSIIKSELPKGFVLEMLEDNTQECLEAMVEQADYVLASGRVKITKHVLDNAVKLKMIQRTGVGLDSLDLKEIQKRKIPLYVNHGVNAESVAEHTLLLILACLRRLPVLHRNTTHGIWKKQEQGIQTYELSGKVIGLLGMGNIARALVRLVKGFNATIIYFDLHRLPLEEEKELGLTYMQFEQMVQIVDILSLHCPLTDDTKKIINKDTLVKMRNGAILINTARGGLIEMPDLIEALKSGQLSFAGLDVFDEEPLKEGNPIISLDNVIITPHVGGVTYDSFKCMMHDAMRNIEKFDKGEFAEIAQYLY